MSDRLDAIEARTKEDRDSFEQCIAIGTDQCITDREYLLDLARKQQAALDAVRNVHAPRKFDPVTDGVYFGQANMDYEVCHHDAELYPCRTISAVEAKP